jgi:hypothetical protein
MIIKILIIHNYNFHYEIIESIINFFPTKILNLSNTHKIFYDIKYNFNNTSFEEYINKNYNNINFTKDEVCIYDYIIYDTIYNTDKLKLNNKKEYYILHSLNPKFNNINNIIYLMPFSKYNSYFIPYILPFNNLQKIKTDIPCLADDSSIGKVPIFIIQGCLERRNLIQLTKIFEKYKNKDFFIKIIGKSNNGLPKYLLKYQKKIIFRPNLNFIDYHKEFLDCTAILPLVEPDFNSDYFKNKLTSSISYGIGYNLKFFCFETFKYIYKLTNCITYCNDTEMLHNFNLLFN